MGFMLEIHSGNHANLLVTFAGNEAFNGYTPTDSVKEAMEYFNLYVKDGELFYRTKEEQALANASMQLQEINTIREKINDLIVNLNDEQAITNTILFNNWQVGVLYTVNERLRYNGILYKVLQEHTSQEGWEPINAPSLFARVLVEDPNIVPDWIQPDSTNGYAQGDKVKHKGDTWESRIDNNVWEPGIINSPWDNLTNPEKEEEPLPTPETEPTFYPEWSVGTTYNSGDRVLFNNQVYESLIDVNVWSPEAYPAGWQLIDESEGKEEEPVTEWEQKIYNIGDKVLYNGQIYQSIIDNNSWSPSDYPAGWTLITE